MKHLLMGFEQIGRHMGTGQDFKSQGSDETPGSGRHDHTNRRRFGGQQPEQAHGFIRGDTSGHAEDDSETGE